MPISATSLVERVRDTLNAYGDLSTTLTQAVGSTTATSFSVDVADGFKAKNWAEVNWECVEITDVNTSTDVLTVRRGSRGTTATTHAQGDVLRFNPPFTRKRILDALNAALSASYPQLYILMTDENSTIVADQYVYDLPAGMLFCCRIEMENVDASNEYYIIRTWDMYDADSIRIYGDYPVGRTLRMVGMGTFDALTSSGNLDADYPTSDSAQSYLIYKASAYLLKERQAQLGVRDAFVGMTDTFSSTQPFASGLSAREMDALAEDMLKQARMTPPASFLALPTRRYLARG